MKKFIIVILVLFSFIFNSFGCEIILSIQEKSKKQVYGKGDEVIIEVSVQLTHRNCPLGIKQTKFSYENLKIIGATDWKEVKPGLYLRQVKVEITEEKAGVAKLIALRSCEKEGGYSLCTFPK